MVRIDIEYLGDLRTKVRHGPSGQEFFTDAPVDNEGKGSSISPTDLVAAALGSCFATILGIVARRHGWNLDGLKIQVDKEMVAQPERRIGRLGIAVHFPAGLSEEQCAALRRAAEACPVHRSLSPQVRVEVTYRTDGG